MADLSIDDLTFPGGPFPLVQRTVNGMVVTAYDREPRTLRDAFLATLVFGDRTALVYGDERWTFTEQSALVSRCAWALRDNYGVGLGDRIVIAMRNYPEWVLAFWACQLLGAVAVPLNAWMTSAELTHLIRHSEPKLIFVDEERLDRIGLSAGVPMVGIRTAQRDGVTPFAELIAQGSSDEPPAANVDPSTIATIVYTSGTTGLPKGVVATHFAHTASLLNRYIRTVAAGSATLEDAIRFRREDQPPKAKLATYPLFHIAGIGTVCAAAFNGHTLALMYKWDVAEAVRIIQREGVSELTGPPLIATQILDFARSDRDALKTLRLLGTGGASIPAQRLAEVQDVFEGRVASTTGYGLTETTGGVIAISGAQFAAHPDKIGLPLPTIEVRLIDEDGNDVPVGQPGELVVRGPQLMQGYYRDEALSRAALAGGWFHTGDQATVDEKGMYCLVGRLKDIVIRGGENINCGQVEAAICEHPHVAEAAAIGVPHPTLGEELAAVVRLNEGAMVDIEGLRSFVGARLAAFKVPAHVHFVTDPLPRTASGKIVKREIELPTAQSQEARSRKVQAS